MLIVNGDELRLPEEIGVPTRSLGELARWLAELNRCVDNDVFTDAPEKRGSVDGAFRAARRAKRVIDAVLVTAARQFKRYHRTGKRSRR